MEGFKGKDISDISALVITLCEHDDAREREEIISCFTERKDIGKFMKKGILCVGFPDPERGEVH